MFLLCFWIFQILAGTEDLARIVLPGEAYAQATLMSGQTANIHATTVTVELHVCCTTCFITFNNNDSN